MDDIRGKKSAPALFPPRPSIYSGTPPRPRPAFPEILAPRSAPAPLFQNFWLPAPLPPRFTKNFGSPPRFPPGGAGSGGRERGLGRGGVDHYYETVKNCVFKKPIFLFWAFLLRENTPEKFVMTQIFTKIFFH